MARILLVVPSAVTFYGLPRYPQLGIAMIGAALLRAGHTVHALDMRLSPRSDIPLVIALRDFNPDIVGFTVTNWDFTRALSCAELVKQERPDTLTVFGGPQPTLCPHETIVHPQVDLVVYGEGEETIVELAHQFASHGTLSHIKGIVYRNGNGHVTDTGPRSLIENLDTLPRPAFELFDLDAYSAGKEKRLGIYSTRGCPYGCTFCTGKSVMGKRIRSRSPVAVVDEMRYWHEYAGINHFCFLEDNCFGKNGHGQELLACIAQAALPVTYSLEVGVRADVLTDALCQNLKTTGCTIIAIGIESAAPHVLELSNKGETIEEIRNGIRAAKRAGLFVKGYFITGLPGDTAENVRKSVQFARDEAIDMPRFALAQAFPHTELEDWVKKNGHFYLEPYEYVLNHTDEFHGEVHFDMPGFPREDIWRMYRWAHNQAEAISFRQALIHTFGPTAGRLLNLLNRSLIRRLIILLYQKRFISLPGRKLS